LFEGFRPLCTVLFKVAKYGQEWNLVHTFFVKVISIKFRKYPFNGNWVLLCRNRRDRLKIIGTAHCLICAWKQNFAAGELFCSFVLREHVRMMIILKYWINLAEGRVHGELL